MQEKKHSKNLINKSDDEKNPAITCKCRATSLITPP